MVDRVTGFGWNYTHLDADAQVKAVPGILHSVVINRHDTTASSIVTLYDSLDASGDVIAIISMDTATNTIPATLVYDLKLSTGLYADFSHEVTADITIMHD